MVLCTAGNQIIIFYISLLYSIFYFVFLGLCSWQKQQDHGEMGNTVDFESLEKTIRAVTTFVNQQHIAQDVMVSQEKSIISPPPQAQRVVEDSTLILPKEDPQSSLRAVNLPLAINNDKKAGEEAQR